MTRIALLLAIFASIARAADIDRTTLFRAGDGDYASYRIPALITTPNGTLLAFCEGRRHSAGDSGEINILLRRSTDSGKTFTPPTVVWADGANTCGNPCAVIDEDTKTVFLLLTHNLGDDHEKDIIAGTAKGSRTVWVTSSTDDGLTWAAPRDITADVKKPDWAWYATGPGVGIQLRHGEHKGRLVVPCDYVAHGGGPGAGNSHVIYSDDHGQTWRLGGQPPQHAFNESQIVELSGGSLLLNMRNARLPKGATQPFRRGVSLSTDGGESFSPARADDALPEPICQGSILRHDDKKILFANPASPDKRERMTVRLSTDDAKTWAASRVVWPGPTGYSCLANLPTGDVALLFEAGDKRSYERIDFARFPVTWLTDPPPAK